MNVSSAVGSYAAMSQVLQGSSTTSTSGEAEMMKKAAANGASLPSVQTAISPHSPTQVRAPEGVKGNTLSIYA